ncbi:MaoC family dehydratase [Comamonas testosteroni]|uniref:MaoC family dehydratase n=1 Tax=Comamonas testosteroni TaxID=285 RepID=UPI0026EA416E|nr:MaoC family dehydratase [Comamonas testosteroni]
MKNFASIDELKAFVGQELLPSPWHQVTQHQVNLFAEATGDHQWIHVDPERARRESPFGGPVAHGYLTLALLPMLSAQVAGYEGAKARVNYGLNRVRFTGPVPVEAKVRIRSVLQEVESEADGGAKLTWLVTFEIDGGTKPVCVAEALSKLYF